MASARSEQPKSQYHHFIPRFILRNFSHPFKPPNPPKGSANRGKRKQKHGHHAGEPMLYSINLANDTAEVIETPVSKTFGLTDMYRDFAHDSNQHHIEEQLSRLECRAGEIVSKIRKAFDAGQTEIWLIRADRNILRKFIFIMKYRAPGFHRRFYHQNVEDYNSDDKERLQRYMREKGFQKPIDVWFDNIKAMLELKMDTRLEWMHALRKRIYPDDAEWFINNTQSFYLALCTPNCQDDEFLLTQNAYSIHEGPVSLSEDPNTGKMTTRAYTEFHIFAPISAKLIIVLRSFLLPSLLEDANEGVREWRQTMLDMNTIQHNQPEKATSLLEDLPVAKALNSYSTIVDGRRVLLSGETDTPQSNHKFCFRFFPVSTEHVNRINTIMLEESHSISMLVFKSTCGARRALESYLGMPCYRSLKAVSGNADDPRLVCLKKLEQAARQLGSSVAALYQTVEPTRVDEEETFRILGQRLASSMQDRPSDAMGPYIKLDMDQSAKMLNMRIKVDVWSQGLAPDIREEIREKVRDLFCRYAAPQRVYYYLKRIRYMKLRGTETNLTPTGKAKAAGSERLDDGPEDVIANLKHLFRDNEALCQAMCQATLNDILLIENPDYGITSQLTLDAGGMLRFQQEQHLVFSPIGIPQVSEEARAYAGGVSASLLRELRPNPLLTGDQNIEMAVRLMLREGFEGTLQGIISGAELKVLEKVLFEVVYPVFAGRCEVSE
ncbi:hypothetical protein FGG08_004867 [Glutinoglossum americanum]|uniref:DUF4238 domain-containing protein n=1 Tax=Glutinoglossum americanum TaxID=1670608 RepID=A0A9P8I1F7_9PEZI|nr:hypothetical protein FGG08_004867 [Glutinoglossum americanum]